MTWWKPFVPPVFGGTKTITGDVDWLKDQIKAAAPGAVVQSAKTLFPIPALAVGTGIKIGTTGPPAIKKAAGGALAWAIPTNIKTGKDVTFSDIIGQYKDPTQWKAGGKIQRDILFGGKSSTGEPIGGYPFQWLSGFTGVDKLPELPELPKLPGIPDIELPKLPELPSAEAIADMFKDLIPDINIPEFPDINIPDFSDIFAGLTIPEFPDINLGIPSIPGIPEDKQDLIVPAVIGLGALYMITKKGGK